METVTFSKSTSFQRDLHDCVELFLYHYGISERGNFALYAKALFFLVGATVSYVFLNFWATSVLSVAASSALVAFFLVGIGFNIQHDGNHNAFSPHDWLNRLAGMTLDLLGTSHWVWDSTHNLWHHTYTNIPLHDGDMEFSKYVRLNEHAPKEWYHKYQHLYVWGFYALAHLSFLFVDYTRLRSGKAGSRSIARPKGLDLVLFVVGKIAFYTIAFVIPCSLHPIWAVLVVYVCISIAIGLTYQLVAESAHCVDLVAHPAVAEGVIEVDWAIHQVQTSANFATNSWFWNWYSGGLNHQREHHLKKKMSHNLYRKIAPVVKRVCDAHDVTYFEYPTFWEAIKGHSRFLKATGS